MARGANSQPLCKVARGLRAGRGSPSRLVRHDTNSERGKVDSSDKKRVLAERLGWLTESAASPVEDLIGGLLGKPQVEISKGRKA